MDPKATESQGPNGRQLPTDGQLVLQTLAGKRVAFDQLVQRYQRQAVAVSYRYLGNTQDALEVSQDAFLKAFSSLKTLQMPEAFGGWLMRIVSNLSLNYRRARKVRWQLSLDEATGPLEGRQQEASVGGDWMALNDDPLRTIASREMGQKLRAALERLPEKQRMAIVLFTIEQLPQKQVAAALDCSVEAVKWHVFQGRKKLKELLKDVL